MPVRVLHLVSQLTPLGATSALIRLLPHLTPGSACQHHVVTLRGHAPALVEPLRSCGVESTSLRSRWSLDPIPRFRFNSLLQDAALLHVWDTVALAWWLQPITSRARRPVLLTLNEPKPLPRSFARRANRRHAHWIAGSETAFNAAAYHSGFAADRGALIPRGTSPAVDPLTPRDQALAAWGLPSDSILIATCGQLVHSRRLKELIWAADMVRVLHPRLRFVLVGDGPARGGLEYFARTAAIPENIVFAGSRDPASLLPHCHVYWEGSQWGDASGMLLDALASGVPVVASDTPLHRESIREGIDGYLVGHTARADRTRVTDQLITDDALHAQMASAARERMAHEHSLAAEVAALKDLYGRLAAG